MSARLPSPLDKWSDVEWGNWAREISSRFRWGSFTWNAPNVPAASTVDTTITTLDDPAVTGTRTGMAIHVTPPATLDNGLVVSAWVATDNTLTVRIGNVTAGDINPASGVWIFSGNLL